MRPGPLPTTPSRLVVVLVAVVACLALAQPGVAGVATRSSASPVPSLEPAATQSLWQ